MNDTTENSLRILLTNPSEGDTFFDVKRISQAASMLGKLGGAVSTPKKAAAARANGRKGGRPPLKKKTSAA